MSLRVIRPALSLTTALAAALLAVPLAQAASGETQDRLVRKQAVKATADKRSATGAQPRKDRPFTAVRKQTPQRAAAKKPGVDRMPVASIGQSSGWLVTINAKAALTPKYTGAAKYGAIAYPTLSFRRPGDPVLWTSPDDSISFRAVESGRFAFGPTLAYRGGRYSANAPDLRGIHKPRWTVEAGAFADLWLAQDMLRARAEVRRGFRKEDGFVATFGADWVMKQGRLTLAAGPRAKWGNDHFVQNQFGVTQADNALNPRYAVYTPKSEFYAIGAYGSATWKQDENWSYTLHGGYDRLRGDAAKSPIVQNTGSRNQWMAGVIASYTFEWK